MEVCGENKNIMWKCSHKQKHTNLELHKSNEKKVENVIFHSFKSTCVCKMLALYVLIEMGLVNCQLFNFIEHNI
jgi:hypothetical protein